MQSIKRNQDGNGWLVIRSCSLRTLNRSVNECPLFIRSAMSARIEVNFDIDRGSQRKRHQSSTLFTLHLRRRELKLIGPRQSLNAKVSCRSVAQTVLSGDATKLRWPKALKCETDCKLVTVDSYATKVTMNNRSTFARKKRSSSDEIPDKPSTEIASKFSYGYVQVQHQSTGQTTGT